MDDSRPLVPFVAICTYNDSKKLVIEASFCAEPNENAFKNFLQKKLDSVEEVRRNEAPF